MKSSLRDPFLSAKTRDGAFAGLLPLVLIAKEVQKPSRFDSDVLTGDDPVPPVCVSSGDHDNTRITLVENETCDDT
jgi:hypothetical protein